MRNSDRLVTPTVVIFFLLVAGGCVVSTVAAVTWLAAHGRDPEPMLKLVGLVVTAATSLGGFLLQLVNRVTATKAERNNDALAKEVAAQGAGHRESLEVLAGAVYEVADALPRPVPRHASTDTVTQPPVPAPALHR